jgi:hypothetical protein
VDLRYEVAITSRAGQEKPNASDALANICEAEKQRLPVGVI